MTLWALGGWYLQPISAGEALPHDRLSIIGRAAQARDDFTAYASGYEAATASAVDRSSAETSLRHLLPTAHAELKWDMIDALADALCTRNDADIVF